MTDLAKKLNRIGKSSFVENYDIYRDFAANKMSKVDAICALLNQLGDTVSSAVIRISYAKKIFNEGKNIEALRIIAGSKRLPLIAKRAAELLK